MTRSVLLLCALPFALSMAGCTSTAGPFITQIRYAGPGQILVDKCTVEFSKLERAISNKDCTTEIVYLQPPPAYAVPAAPPAGYAPTPTLPPPPPPAEF